MSSDPYGHLYPGNEKDSADKLDKHLGFQVDVAVRPRHPAALYWARRMILHHTNARSIA